MSSIVKINYMYSMEVEVSDYVEVLCGLEKEKINKIVENYVENHVKEHLKQLTKEELIELIVVEDCDWDFVSKDEPKGFNKEIKDLTGE